MDGQLGGAALYNRLYAVGYHQNTGVWHAQRLVHQIKCDRITSDQKAPRGCNETAWAPAVPLDSVLDVGCSHGRGVWALWETGVGANGIDVSENAIALANRTRLKDGAPGRCPYQPCFRQASASALPFPDRSFDAVMSTDVLEHVEAADVKAAVAEVTRVARRRIYAKISNRGEGNRKDLDTLKKSGAAVPAALHATVQGPLFWEGLFDEQGWALHHMLEDVARATPAWWDCCTYIFRPATPETREAARAAAAARAQTKWYHASMQIAARG